MEFLVVCVVFGVLGYFVLGRPGKQIRLGQHLTQMTNVFEEIERTRHTMCIGAGGGIDSLPAARQREAEAIFESGVAHLKTYPRHEITRELIKNALLAERTGRQLRVNAIQRLIEALARMDVALDVDDFARSYG